jgi:hypothetical protein
MRIRKPPKKLDLDTTEVPSLARKHEDRISYLIDTFTQMFKIEFKRVDFILSNNLFKIFDHFKLNSYLKKYVIPPDGDCYFTVAATILKEVGHEGRIPAGNEDAITDGNTLRHYIATIVMEDDYLVEIYRTRTFTLKEDIHDEKNEDEMKQRSEDAALLRNKELSQEERVEVMRYPELYDLVDVEESAFKDSLNILLRSQDFWADDILIPKVDELCFVGRFVRLTINTLNLRIDDDTNEVVSGLWPYEIHYDDCKTSSKTQTLSDGTTTVSQEYITTDIEGQRIPKYPFAIAITFDGEHFDLVASENSRAIDLRVRSIFHDLFNLAVYQQ